MGTWEEITSKGPRTLKEQATGVVQQLAPMATSISSKTDIEVQQAPTLNSNLNISKGTWLEQFGNFAGTFAGQAVNLAGSAIKWVADEAYDTLYNTGRFVVGMVTAPVNLVANTIKNDDIARQVKANNEKSANLTSSYQSGSITKDQYIQGMNETYNESQRLMKEANGLATLSAKQSNEISETVVDAELTIATIMTAGLAGGIGKIAVTGADVATQTAAKAAIQEPVKLMINFFGKKEVSYRAFQIATKIDDLVKGVVTTTNKIGTFNGRLPAGQVFRLTEDIIAKGGANLTSKEIAKNVTIGILFKKPLIYQTDLDIATDVYKDLLKGDLAGAGLSLVATAAMTMTGGPIGFALEAVGKAGKWAKRAMFSSKSITEILEEENKMYTKEGITKIRQEFLDAQAGKKVAGDSFIDQLSVHIGDGSDSQITKVILEDLTNGTAKTAEFMKVMEEINTQMSHGNVNQAVRNIVDYYEGIYGKGYLRTVTAKEIVTDMVDHAESRQLIVQNAIKNGLSKEEAKRIVIGRATQKDMQAISAFMTKADESVQGAIENTYLDSQRKILLVEARHAYLDTLIEKQGRLNACWNSKTFMKQITDIIENTRTTPDMVKKINSITSGHLFEGKLDKEVVDYVAGKGYFAVLPKETRTPYVEFAETSGKLVSKYSDTATGDAGKFFEQAVKPVPVLSSIGTFLTRLGLSPVEAEEQVYRTFKTNFSSLIKEVDTIRAGKTAVTGDVIMTKLNNYMRDYNASPGFTRKIIDPRQLTRKEIVKVLECTESDATKILKALNTSMLNIPVRIRGLGDKLQDINTALNPLAAQYARTQGALRYTYNPFFRWQQSYQTESFVQMEVAAQKLGFKPVQTSLLNRVNKVVFREFEETNNLTVKLLEDRNIFAPGFSGESVGSAFGAVGTGLIKSEKKSLAGLVQLQAKNAGYTDIGKYIDDHLEETIDTMRMLTMHGKVKDFTDSPLARTINTVFFPFRYNMKTANLMAQYIGKLPATTQVAILANYFKAKDWLDSKEGIAWQSQYSEAIKLFSWLSPTYPLSYVMKLAEDVVDPEDASVGDLGMLGGLPFGMISQLLESHGVITSSAPYVDPKTGDVYPKYVPQTAKAEVNLAIQSFIGSIWSYPGTIIGLPGKGSLIRGVTNAAIGGQNEFEQVDQSGRMTPEQIRMQQVLQGQTNNTVPQAPIENTNTNIPVAPVTAPPRQRTRTTRAKVTPRPI